MVFHSWHESGRYFERELTRSFDTDFQGFGAIENAGGGNFTAFVHDSLGIAGQDWHYSQDGRTVRRRTPLHRPGDGGVGFTGPGAATQTLPTAGGYV